MSGPKDADYKGNKGGKGFIQARWVRSRENKELRFGTRGCQTHQTRVWVTYCSAKRVRIIAAELRVPKKPCYRNYVQNQGILVKRPKICVYLTK